MKLSVSCAIFLSVFMLLTPSFAGTQTLSTYYPAPQGNYLNMTINNSFAFASQANPCSYAAGSLAVTLVNVNGTLEVCDSSASGPQPLIAAGLWASVSGSTPYIYPSVSGNNVCIGSACSTTAPANTLYVNGTIGSGSDVDVGGNVNLATGNVAVTTGNVTITAGTLAVAAGLATFGADVGIQTTAATDPITNTTDPGYGLGVNGTVNLNGPTTITPSGVSNGTAFIPPNSVAGNNLQINGQYTGTIPPAGTTTNTVPAIYVCNASGANCGYLAVAQGPSCATGGDCNYYAVYGS